MTGRAFLRGMKDKGMFQAFRRQRPLTDRYLPSRDAGRVTGLAEEMSVMSV